MRPVVSALHEKYADEVYFILADTSTEKGSNLARAYQIRVTPTVILFDRDGSEAERFTGLQTKSSLGNRLQAVLDGEDG